MGKRTAQPPCGNSTHPPRDAGGRRAEERPRRTVRPRRNVKEAIDYIVETHERALKELEKH